MVLQISSEGSATDTSPDGTDRRERVEGCVVDSHWRTLYLQR